MPDAPVNLLYMTQRTWLPFVKSLPHRKLRGKNDTSGTDANVGILDKTSSQSPLPEVAP